MNASSRKNTYSALRRWLGWLFRPLFTLLLLLWLYQTIPSGTLSLNIQSIELIWFIPAIALLVLGYWFAALRWYVLARHNHYPVNLWLCFRWYWMGTLINQGLPSTLGGDAFRAWQMHQNRKFVVLRQDTKNIGLSLVQSASLVALDRFMGLISLLIVGFIAMLYVEPLRDKGLVLLLLLMFSLSLLFAALHPATARFIRKVCPPCLKENMTRFGAKPWLNKILTQYQEVFPLIRKTLSSFVFARLLPLGLLIHLVGFAAFALCFRAFGVSYPFSLLVLAIATSGLLALLPISVSGWGLRENILFSLLNHWGFNATNAVPVSLSYGFLMLLSCLPALYFFLRRRVLP